MLKKHQLNVYTPQAANGTLHLITLDDKPLKLGEGRFAVVYLGSNAKVSGDDAQPDALDVGNLVALKFLKRVDSESVTSNSIYRFCQEAMQTSICASNGLGSVTAFFGYGRTRPLPPPSSRELQLLEEAFRVSLDVQPNKNHFLFGLDRRIELDKRFSGQDVERYFEVPLTGDFYGLELCLMSLEELLLTRGDPFQVSSGKALKECGVLNAPFLTSAAHHYEFLKDLPYLTPPANGNGFQDLEALAHWIQQQEPSQTGLKERFHDAVLFGLAIKCLTAARPLHEAKSVRNVDRAGIAANPTDDVGFAHRDLKPANILLSLSPDTLKLSDLGFVSSVGDIRVANYTALASMDEGGVLPLGSKGFRAPEQIESGEDFRFKPIKKASASFEKSSIGSIEIFAYLDTEIDVGDFLKLDGHYVDGKKLARIKSVPPNRDSVEYQLTAQPASSDDQKGRLIKDVSLHSDIYSIGCIAYYLGSEGQNPERFMRFFLDRVAIDRLKTTLPPWVLESPLWMAAALCQAKNSLIKTELKAHAKSRTSTTHTKDDQYEKRMATVERALGFGKVVTLVDKDAARIYDFRQGLGANDASGQLLVGRITGIPISFPLLYLILQCCMRGAKYGVVRRETDVFDENNSYVAVYARDAHNFARRIEAEVSVLSQGASLSGRWPRLSTLSPNPPDPAQMFINARLAWRAGPIGTRDDAQSADDRPIAAGSAMPDKLPNKGAGSV